MSKSEVNFDGEIGALIERVTKVDFATVSQGVLENNYAKWLSRRLSAKYRLDFLPGRFQHSPTFLDYKKKCFDDLKDLSESATFSNANQALGLWSYPCSAAPLGTENVEENRKNLKLKEPSARHQEIARQLAKRMCLAGDFSAIHLRSRSMTGFPCFTIGKEAKAYILENTLKNIAVIKKYVEEENYERLASEHGILPLFTTGVRIQQDRITVDQHGFPNGKTRKAYKPEAFERGIFNEQYMFEIDFSTADAVELGASRKFFYAGRARAMYAFSYSLNCVLQILQNFLYNGLKKISFNVCYSGSEALALEISNFLGTKNESMIAPDGTPNDSNLVSLDKAQFDTTMSSTLLRILCEVIEEELGWGNFVWATLKAPTLSNQSYRGANLKLLTRKNFSTDHLPSFKSGHGLVAIIGKFLGLCDALVELEGLLGNKFDLELLLKNNHADVRMYNSGDDTLFVFRDAAMALAFKNKERVGVHSDEVEKKPLYLGDYYTVNGYYKDSGKLVESVTGNERGLFGKTFYMLGFAAREQAYSMCPETPRILEVCYRNSFEILGFDFDRAVEAFRGKTLTSADELFITNPESVFYKLDIEEVSDDLIKEEFEIVKPEEYRKYFKLKGEAA